ncbi:unnamed protein product, partial [Chrysoparadoxa australica]
MSGITAQGIALGAVTEQGLYVRHQSAVEKGREIAREQKIRQSMSVRGDVLYQERGKWVAVAKETKICNFVLDDGSGRRVLVKGIPDTKTFIELPAAYKTWIAEPSNIATASSTAKAFASAHRNASRPTMTASGRPVAWREALLTQGSTVSVYGRLVQEGADFVLRPAFNPPSEVEGGCLCFSQSIKPLYDGIILSHPGTARPGTPLGASRKRPSGSAYLDDVSLNEGGEDITVPVAEGAYPGEVLTAQVDGSPVGVTFPPGVQGKPPTTLTMTAPGGGAGLPPNSAGREGYDLYRFGWALNWLKSHGGPVIEAIRATAGLDVRLEGRV